MVTALSQILNLVILLTSEHLDRVFHVFDYILNLLSVSCVRLLLREAFVARCIIYYIAAHVAEVSPPMLILTLRIRVDDLNT